MLKNILFRLFLAGLAVSVAGARAQPATDAPSGEVDHKPNIERIGKGRFRIGGITLDKTSETLRLPATVNMREGLIELIACSSGGKLHESIFLALTEPYDLQIALLLLGLQSKGGLEYQGDPATPQGDQVLIWVEHEGKQRRVEDYVWNQQQKAPMQRTGWVFSGSKILDDGRFAAQVTRTLITTYHDPYTILDNPLSTGADDTLYYVHTDVTPPVGTTVTLVMKPLKAKTEPKGDSK